MKSAIKYLRLSTERSILYKKTVSGQVVDSDGNGVSNATVELTAVNYDKLNGTLEEKNQTANELLAQAKNPQPPDWDPGISPMSTSGAYVAIHETTDWGGGGIARDPSLGKPRIVAPANQQFALSVWDPNENPTVPDTVTNDLPGAPVDREIVIEQIGTTGEVISSDTISPTRSVETFYGQREHPYATFELDRGFYRVYPKSDPQNAYIISAGDPAKVTQMIESELRDRAGYYTEQVEDIRSKLNDNTFTRITATTDENGDFSVDVPQQYQRVSVQAYKIDGQTLTSLSNPTLADAREFHNATDFEGSVYFTPTPTETSVPASNIRVTVAENPTFPNVELDDYYNTSQRLSELFGSNGLNQVSDALNGPASDYANETLSEVGNRLERITDANTELAQCVASEYDGPTGINENEPPSFDNEDISREQQLAKLDAMEQCISETRDTIDPTEDVEDAEDRVTDIGENLVSARFIFDDSIDSDNVAVFAHWTNGTTTAVGDEYVSVDQSAAGAAGLGSTTVRITDFPLGEKNPAAVAFEARVATEDGTGSQRTPSIKRPTFDGTVPKIQSIDLSTLSPGPSERVSVRVSGTDDSSFRNVTQARVVYPDGSEQTISNVSNGNTVQFDTNGRGVHHISLTVEDVDGNQYQVPITIPAAKDGRDRPPGVMAKDSVYGTYALVGDGLDGGKVDVSPFRIGMTAILAQGEDPPPKVHFYTTSIDAGRDASVTLRVVRGESQESVSRHVQVAYHTRSLSDDALVYRETTQPLVKDEKNQFGKVTTQTENGSVLIETYTQADGAVDIRTVNNPSRLERLSHWISRQRAGIDIPLLSVSRFRLPALSQLFAVGGTGV